MKPGLWEINNKMGGSGDTGANLVRATLNTPLNPGQTAILRARVRWLSGHPTMLLRLRGSLLQRLVRRAQVVVLQRLRRGGGLRVALGPQAHLALEQKANIAFQGDRAALLDRRLVHQRLERGRQPLAAARLATRIQPARSYIQAL
jgi:hypothetical protein